MLTLTAFIASVILTADIVESVCKNGQDPNFCSRVRCINKKESDCNNFEVYIPRNPKECVCCGYCEAKPGQCGYNEEYTDCGTACPKTCSNKDDPDKKYCIDLFVKGCFCKKGYVKNDNGLCVKPERCPADQGCEPDACQTIDCADVTCKKDEIYDPSGGYCGCCPACIPKPKNCGPNEEYDDCGTACPKTCANKDIRISCIDVCEKGCFCKRGYVRNDDGKCVNPDWCPKEQCGLNEEYKKCGTACPRTCRNKDALIKCTSHCEEGCFCKDGYFRNDEWICVKPGQCPPAQCGLNEVFTDCGTACPKTCTNKDDKNIICTLQCVRGCFCKEGFVRSDKGTCIRIDQCPPAQCGLNEEYTDCGTACPKTCKNKDEVFPCTLQCVIGCVCKEGYVRNDAGKCIRIDQCPTEQCGWNEEYRSCGTACPKTCKNKDKPIFCTYQCVQGCFCIDGYVRNDAGKCIKQEQCPTAQCGLNEVYTECGTACPKTCKNKDQVITCTAQCVIGCVCKKGYVRNDAGICIRIDQCPTAQCGFNEVYTECGTACPKTCKNKDQVITCTAQCVIGCVCRKGYVRNGAGKCIRIDQCPTEEECRPGICSVVLCLRVDEGDCKPNEVYEPFGGYCGCCSACVPKPAGDECGRDVCSRVKCEAVPKRSCKPNQVYDPKGGYCGCCPACITLLNEWQECQQPVKGGSPPTKRCKPGLYCDPKWNKCVQPCDDSDSSSASASASASASVYWD